MKDNLIGDNLKRLRDTKGLDVPVLAGKIDMSKQYLLRLEAGKQRPTVNTLYKLSKALGCKIGDFFVDAANQNSLRRGKKA
jgi:transcriptional regulator with XRE-family HTH domain